VTSMTDNEVQQLKLAAVDASLRDHRVSVATCIRYECPECGQRHPHHDKKHPHRGVEQP